MPVIQVPPASWRPREDQMDLWRYLEQGGKRAVEVAHRRWGKDEIALHFTATRAMLEPANYWHLLPKYEQGRRVLWDAINPRTGKRRIDEAFPEAIRRRTRHDTMFIEFCNGATWQVVGSDNYNSLVGAPPKGIVFSEWSLADPMCWAYLAPMLEENDGWALWIYTSRGKNHGKTLYEQAQSTDGWYAQKMPATKTPVFNQEQLDRIEDEYITLYGEDLGRALFAQEYLCSFEGAVLGAYYAAEMARAEAEGRICDVPWDPTQEVETFWDLGVSDTMAVWFMQTGPVGQYLWIDYEESVGKGLEWWAKKLKEKPYTYAAHWMPHDAKKRELSSGTIARSVKQVAEDLGIKPIQVVERPKNMEAIVTEQIPAVRRALAKSYFDKTRCARGIEALENYRAEYDERKKVIAPRPLHDWASHAADAMRTFVQGWRPKKDTSKPLDIHIRGIV